MDDREPPADADWLNFEDSKGRIIRPSIEDKRKSLGWYAGTLLALLATIAVASGLVWVITLIWQAIL